MVTGAMAAPGLSGLLRSAAVAQVTPQPHASPHAPDPNFPAGMDGPKIIHGEQSQRSLVNQQQTVELVDELYRLCGQLKQEADTTNLNMTFPIDFVKRARDIEKLAKQIRERAKG